MGHASGTASKITATVLIIVNAVVLMFSALLFALGLWVTASPSTLLFTIRTFGCDYIKVLFTEETLNLHVGIAFAIVSCFLFFISLMGLCGAISCSKFLLFMYSILVLLLLLLEYSLMYYFSSDIVQKGLKENDGQWTAHAFRLAFHCCEHNSTSPYVAIPWSCCGVESYPNNCTFSQSFKNDCQHIFKTWLNTYEITIYVGLAVIHIVMSSCSLIRRACCASRSYD